MAAILVPMLAVMLGATLVLCGLMTPVDKAHWPKRLRAAICGFTGVFLILAGLVAVCILAFSL